MSSAMGRSVVDKQIVLTLRPKKSTFRFPPLYSSPPCGIAVAPRLALTPYIVHVTVCGFR